MPRTFIGRIRDFSAAYLVAGVLNVVATKAYRDEFKRLMLAGFHDQGPLAPALVVNPNWVADREAARLESQRTG
jgi:hypothetical protein